MARLYSAFYFRLWLWETTLVILSGGVRWCWWKQRGAGAERWDAARHLPKPSCLHIATPSPRCSFEGVTKHLFSRGVGRISKKWGVMRPQEGRAYLEIQLQLEKLEKLRCPAAQQQRRTQQKKKKRGKRRDMSDGDCSQVGKACCLGLQPTRGPLTKSFYQRFPQNHTERWRERGSHAV